MGSEPALRLPTRKAEALLAYLALSAGQAHQRDKLAALLWGDASDEKARGSLRRAIAGIRKALGESARSTLATAGHTLAVNPSAVDVDVEEFERRVAQGTPEALEQALALYRGDLLEGLSLNEPPFEEWLLSERERLRELALEVLARVLARQSRAEQTERAIQTALRLLTLDPLQEPVHQMLMRLYARQGRWAAALRQYQVCVEILERELGLEPEAETKTLYQELLRRHLTLSPSVVVTPTRPRHRPGHAVAAIRDLFSARLPLIGRQAELDWLRGALEEVSRGAGRVIAVLGEAGIGKSRLVEELADEGVRRGCRLLLGRAHEIERALPFGPWVDAFRSGQVAADRKVIESLSPVWRMELARLFPEWGEASEGHLPSAGESLRLFEAIVHLIGILASPQPLVLILEDLQWADDMSLRLLSFASHRLAASSALVVATAREEEIDGTPLLRRFISELDRERRGLQLLLPPLSRADTGALVRTLARASKKVNALARAGERIWAISEGNPFAVVEVVRSILAGTVPATPSRLPVPARVQELVGRRLERLSHAGRKLVSVAAVVGREFEFTVLQQASGLTERTAAAGVEELVRKRVFHGSGDRFDFTHDRIREVARDRLPLARRRALHAAVANALEQVHAADLAPHYAALGTHSWEGGLWTKAETYLRHAGVQARQRAAHREAVRFFERALLALERLPASRGASERAIDLRFDLRNSLAARGEFERIGHELAKAGTIAEGLGDRRRLAQLSVHMTHHFRIAGELRRAIACGQRALSTATTLDDFALAAGASCNLAASCYALGDYRRAADLLTKLVPSLDGDLIRERFGTSGATSVISRFYLAWCLGEQGEFARGLAAGSEALRIAETTGNPYELAAAHAASGYVLLRKGDLREAVVRLERGLAFCRSADIPLYYRDCAAALGYAYALSRRRGEAVRLLDGALEQDLKMGIVYNQSLHLSWLAEAHLLAGRIKAAIELAGRALDLCLQHEARGFQAWILRLLGEIHTASRPRDVATAETYYRKALALGEELGMRPLIGHCHLGLGKLYGRRGKPHQARERLTTATTIFREMDMQFWAAKAELAAARE